MNESVFLKKGIVLTIFRISQVLIGFSITMLITRNLGEEIFGAYSYGLASIILINIFVAQGLPNYCSYCAAKKNVSFNFINVIYLYAIILASTLSIFIVYGVSWLEVEKKEVIIKFLPMLFIISILQINCGFLLGKNKVYHSEFLEFFLRPALMASFIIFMVIFTTESSLSGVINNQILATVIPLIFSSYFVYKIIGNGEMSFDYLTELKTSLGFFGARAGVLANQQIGIIFIGTYLTFNDVASFRMAEQISLILSLGLHALNSMLTPHIHSAIESETKKNEIKKLIRYLTRWLFTGVFILALLLIFFANQIYEVFGIQPRYEHLMVLKILILGQVSNVLTGCNGLILIMSGNAILVSKVSIGFLIITITMLYITSEYVDLIDVAYIVVGSKILYNLFLAYLAHKKTNINTTIF